MSHYSRTILFRSSSPSSSSSSSSSSFSIVRHQSSKLLQTNKRRIHQTTIHANSSFANYLTHRNNKNKAIPTTTTKTSSSLSSFQNLIQVEGPKHHYHHHHHNQNPRFVLNPSCFSTLTTTTITSNNDNNDTLNDKENTTQTKNNRKKELLSYIQQMIHYDTEHLLHHFSKNQRRYEKRKRGRNVLARFEKELKQDYYRRRRLQQQQQQRRRRRREWEDGMVNIGGMSTDTPTLSSSSSWDKEDGIRMDNDGKSSSSLLDLLNDDYNHDDNDKSFTNYGKDESETFEKRNDKSYSSLSSSSSLLDLLDDDDDYDDDDDEDEEKYSMSTTTRHEEDGDNNDDEKEMKKRNNVTYSSSSSSSSSSLLDLLDNDNDNDDKEYQSTPSSFSTTTTTTTLQQQSLSSSSSSSGSLLDLMNENYHKDLVGGEEEEKDTNDDYKEEHEKKREGNQQPNLLDLLDDYPSSSSSSLMNENKNESLKVSMQNDDDNNNKDVRTEQKKKRVPSLLELLDNDDVFTTHSNQQHISNPIYNNDDNHNNNNDNHREFVQNEGDEINTTRWNQNNNNLYLEDGTDFAAATTTTATTSSTTATTTATGESIFTNYDNYDAYFHQKDDQTPKDYEPFLDYKEEKEKDKEEEEEEEWDDVFRDIFDTSHNLDNETKRDERSKSTFEFGNVYGDENGNNFSLNNETTESRTTKTIKPKKAPATLNEILNRAIALRTVTRRKDWDMLFRREKKMNKHGDDNDDGNEEEDEGRKKNDVNLFDNARDEIDDIHHDEKDGAHNHDPIFPTNNENDDNNNDKDFLDFFKKENNDATTTAIQELLNGCAKHQWMLTTDEFNLLLLHVASSADAAAAAEAVTSNRAPMSSLSSSCYEENIKLLLRIYNYMTELSALQREGVDLGVGTEPLQPQLQGGGVDDDNNNNYDAEISDKYHNSGRTTCAPNATTYFILLTTLEQSGDIHAASRLCTKLLEEKKRNNNNNNTASDTTVSASFEDAIDAVDNNHNNNNNWNDATELKTYTNDDDGGNGGKFELDDRVLGAAMRILRRRNRLDDAHQLFEWAAFGGQEIDKNDGNGDIDDHSKSRTKRGNVHIDCGVFKALLQLYKDENMQKEAVKLIDICVRENGKHDKRGVHSFLSSLINWPKRSRDGQCIILSSHCQALLDALERIHWSDQRQRVNDTNGFTSSLSSFYRPNYLIWKRLLLSAVNAAKFESPTHWILVSRTFRAMMENLPPSSFPDHVVFRVGLDAAEITKDPNLAHDIISWAWRAQGQNRASNGFTSSFEDTGIVDDDDTNIVNTFGCIEGKEEFSDVESDNNNSDTNGDALYNYSDPNKWTPPESLPGKTSNYVHVPPQAYLRVIQLCVGSDEVDLARDILDNCSKNTERIPRTLLQQMYTLVMAGYAKGGDVDNTKQLLIEMQNEGPRPSEKAYGAVIHALSMRKRAAEASEIIDSMLSNDYGDGVRPGPSSFSSCMLSLIQSKDWEGVLLLNEKMNHSGVPPTPTTLQGVVLAWNRLGKRQRAIEAIEQSCDSELTMDSDFFQACARLFLPDTFENTSIPHMRKKLRQVGEREPDLADVALGLGRSLRIAELNKDRHPDVRRKCWKDAIKSLVRYIQRRDTT